MTMPAFALKVGQMGPKEWHATLMIDKIQLTPGFSYDASSGMVFGAPPIPLADGTLPDGCHATHAVVYAWWCQHPLEAGCIVSSNRQFLFGESNEEAGYPRHNHSVRKNKHLFGRCCNRHGGRQPSSLGVIIRNCDWETQQAENLVCSPM